MAKKEKKDARTYIPAEDPYHMPIPVERRRRKDFFSSAITWCSLLAFAAAVFSLLFLNLAMPNCAAVATFTGQLHGTEVNLNVVYFAYALMISSLSICVIGTIFNMFRHRRKSDKFRKSLFIIALLSIAGIVCVNIIYL